MDITEDILTRTRKDWKTVFTNDELPRAIRFSKRKNKWNYKTNKPIPYRALKAMLDIVEPPEGTIVGVIPLVGVVYRSIDVSNKPSKSRKAN